MYLNDKVAIEDNGLVLCEVFRHGTKPSFGLRPK